jgi:hypothetical protein
VPEERVVLGGFVLPEVEPRCDLDLELICPRTHCRMRTSRWLSVAALPAGGMKSTTWPRVASV